MDELSLLRDYVTTMQRQLQSKNRQLRTLTQQNQKLLRQNQQLSMKKSSVFTSSSVCSTCDKTKYQLSTLQSLCNQLQIKYDSLQRQKNTINSSSVRVLSTSCTQCSRVKAQLQSWKSKYNTLEQSQRNKTSSTKLYYANTSCSQCSSYRSEIKTKDQIIAKLRSQLSNYNLKISSLQSQIQNLNITISNNSKPIVYSQTTSRPNDLQRISYLNGQVQQYIALVNSLRNQIKILNEENQRYIFRIRQLQSRPREIQYIQKQINPQFKQQIRALRIQIGQLSNDNILLRRQNANLKRQVMNLPRNQPVIIQSGIKQISKNYSPINYIEQRQGKHFRKSNLSKKSEQNIYIENLPYNQKVKYQDLQRKIEMLQMQNDYLKGTFYSQI